MTNRTHQILFRLNEKEYQAFIKKVEKTGLSREAYLRYLIQNITPKELPSMDFFNVIKQLDQINNNMNQIAVKAHSLKYIDAPMYEKNCEKLDETMAEIMHQVFK